LLEIALMSLQSDHGSLRPKAPELDATASFSGKQAAVQRANEPYLRSHGLVGQDRRADHQRLAMAPTAPMPEFDPASALNR